MRHVWLPQENRVLSVPPKCGSSAVYYALEETFTRPLADAPNDVQVFKAKLIPPTAQVTFVVRDPIDRFRSLWRNKCRDGGKVAGFGTMLAGLTPEELFDLVRYADNYHWIRQAELFRELPYTASPPELVRLENLSKWWAENLPEFTPLIERNATTALDEPELSSTLRAALDQWYAEDVEMWRRAC